MKARASSAAAVPAHFKPTRIAREPVRAGFLIPCPIFAATHPERKEPRLCSLKLRFSPLWLVTIVTETLCRESLVGWRKGMRAIPDWLTVGSLLFVLAGCAMPYYATPPARVYYPLQPANIYYPPQRASLSDPRASFSPDRSQSRSSKARHRRPPAAHPAASTDDGFHRR